MTAEIKIHHVLPAILYCHVNLFEVAHNAFRHLVKILVGKNIFSELFNMAAYALEPK